MFTFLWGEDIFFSKDRSLCAHLPRKIWKKIYFIFPDILIGFFVAICCLFCDIWTYNSERFFLVRDGLRCLILKRDYTYWTHNLMICARKFKLKKKKKKNSYTEKLHSIFRMLLTPPSSHFPLRVRCHDNQGHQGPRRHMTPDSLCSLWGNA